MKILVTGAKGFVGRNLCASLNNIREGKDRTRPDLQIEDVFEYDIDTEPGKDYHVWQPGTAIEQTIKDDISHSPVVTTLYYDLQGRRVSKDVKGIIIEKRLHADYSVTTSKIINR